MASMFGCGICHAQARSDAELGRHLAEAHMGALSDAHIVEPSGAGQ